MKLARTHDTLITSAELEMHGIASFSLPTASPFKAGAAKNCDYYGIHVAVSSLLIRFRIQIDGDAPGMS